MESKHLGIIFILFIVIFAIFMHGVLLNMKLEHKEVVEKRQNTPTITIKTEAKTPQKETKKLVSNRFKAELIITTSEFQNGEALLKKINDVIPLLCSSPDIENIKIERIVVEND